MDLPVIELTLEDLENDRVEAIAFVDNPAIQRNWMAFNSDDAKPKFEFKTADTEKRIVAGPLMVADMPIYRNYEGKKFFVVFKKETIEQIVNKFMKEGRVSAFNNMHNEADKLSNVYLQQSFIIDSTKGINTPMGYETLSDGSWFGFVKVDDDKIWNDYVKTGQLNGFSVEGQFSEKKHFNIMNKLEEILEKFSKKFGLNEEPKEAQAEPTKAVMGSAKLTDGTMVTWEGDLAEGTPVMSEAGSPVEDGDYTFEDGTVISVAGGVVAAIASPQAPAEPAEMAAETIEPNAEIVALKAEIETLKASIESNKPTDYSEQFAKIDENIKDLFEAIKLSYEDKDNKDLKAKFKNDFEPVKGLGRRSSNFLQSKTK